MKAKNNYTYKDCYLWKKSQEQNGIPLRPLARVICEGHGNIEKCPHCHSTTSNGMFGFITKHFGSKRFCINKSCIYHFFDIRKGDVNFDSKKEFLYFVKQRVREAKLKNIIKHGH